MFCASIYSEYVYYEWKNVNLKMSEWRAKQTFITEIHVDCKQNYIFCTCNQKNKY